MKLEKYARFFVIGIVIVIGLFVGLSGVGFSIQQRLPKQRRPWEFCGDKSLIRPEQLFPGPV